jgi:tellurite resistance protein TerA
VSGGGGGGVDLDLGCLWELQTGHKGAIQALGNALGSFEQPPFIMHCGDDRTGAWSEGENIRINTRQMQYFRRILIYSFIYEGVANWSQADGVVTVKQPGSPDIVVQLDDHRNGVIMCAIALFENVGDTFRVQKAVQYFMGHEEMDRAFGWGLRWVAGSK